MADVGPVSSFTARSPVVLSTDRLYIDDGAGADWSLSLAVLMASLTKVNNVTITKPATGSTLTIADGKTLTISNSLTLAGTDATTMTFPSTSATIARTDAGNTFTGHQTIEGVTSTGATGTGRFVFDNTPTLITPVLGIATGTSLVLGGATIGGDVFAATGTSTHNGKVTINAAALQLSGNITQNGWTTAGIRFTLPAVTYTDNNTGAGTVATAYTDLFGVSTIATSANAVTFTNYFGSYFQAPVAGSHVTFTNAWALGADSLKVGTSNQFSISVAGQVIANAIAIGGATPANALDVSGAARISSTITSVNGNLTASSGSLTLGSNTSQILIGSSFDLAAGRLGPNSWRFGNPPSTTPVAQTVTIGEASRGGTDTDVAGANGTIEPGAGTGAGQGASLLVKTPTTGTTGTTAQTYATRLTINDVAATFVPPVVHGLPENLKAYTVGTLPTGSPGDYAYVTDDTLSTWNSTLTGGSNGYTPVFKNATVWVSV